MPVTVVLQGAAAARCTVRVSPLAELCACLHAFSDPDRDGHHQDSAEWIAKVRAEISPLLVDEIEAWAPLWGSRRAQFMFPTGVDGEHSLDAEMSVIDRLPLGAFVAMAADPIVDFDKTIAYDRLLGAGPDREALLERAGRMSQERLTLARLLLSNPEGFRRRLTTFLWRFCAQVFEPEWRRMLPALRAEADRRRRELHLDGLAVIGRVAPTAKELHNPHRVVFDKLYDAMPRLSDDPCVLLPSAFAGPHLIVKHVRGLPIAVQYAVSPAEESSFDEVDRRIKALSDSSRVRICRAILRQRRTTVDLAAYTGMAEPQVSRHLRRLREAGLVRTSREGRLVYYEMDIETLKRIGHDLYDALWR